MKLNEQVKQKIKEFNNTLDSNVELEDRIVILILYQYKGAESQ
jgi:hypothetical protein